MKNNNEKRPRRSETSIRPSRENSKGTADEKRNSFRKTGSTDEKRSFFKKSDKGERPAGRTNKRTSDDKPFKKFSKETKDFSDKRPRKTFGESAREGSEESKPRRSFTNKPRPYGAKPSAAPRSSSLSRPSKPENKRRFSSEEGTEKRFKPKFSEDKRNLKKDGFKSSSSEYRREYKPKFNSTDKPKEFKPRTNSSDKPREFKPRPDSSDKSRPYKSKNNGGFQRSNERSDKGKKYDTTNKRPFDKSASTEEKQKKRFDREGAYSDKKTRAGRLETKRTKPAPEYNLEKYDSRKKEKTLEGEQLIRLNRYISNAGVCSRRDADQLIEAGEIKVNGNVVTEMGYQVGKNDIVKYGNRVLNKEKLVYVLLNKPKDYITTTEDPDERKTVMDLVKNACEQRIYPVGRLDRNTTGLLLLTNDGEIAEKLAHPSNNIKKIYQVELNKPIIKEDFEQILAGVQLEDGLVTVDDLAIVSPDRMVLGIEIHIGRNRIVRRLFEHLGYEVTKLDRVSYAGLTKKDLPRGNWRFLNEKEVIKLKYFI